MSPTPQPTFENTRRTKAEKNANMPLPPTRILITGAGVAGPAFAAMLLSSPRSYAITVVERAKSLRTGGHQIDLRSHGLSVAKKMGILATIKSRCVKESGIAFVDRDSNIKAKLGVNDSGRGQQSLTSEYEIMRRDLVDVMYQTSLAAAERAAARSGIPSAAEVLRYEFGKHVTQIVQQGASGRGGPDDDVVVDVVFSDGSEAQFDLVVAADGQGSRTRHLAFGDAAGRDAFRPLGVYSALYTVARDDAAELGDPHLAKMCHAPGKRVLATRTGDARVTQVGLSTMRPSQQLVDAMARGGAGGLEAQKSEWEELFRGAGWQEDRLLKGLRTTEDFYSYAAGQVKMDRWSKGRVVMLGDAGYCPSPMTGMGTTCALTGGYILAGELARHGEDVDAALREYEKVGRPFIDEAQKLPEGRLKWWYHDTNLQVRLFHMFLGTLTKLKVDKMMQRLLPETKGGLEIPIYPELEYLAQDAAQESQESTAGTHSKTDGVLTS